MKKMNFEQMEVIHGGQTVSSAYEATITEDGIRLCVVGKWITGLGIVAIAAGASFTCGAAAVAYGVIAGATTIWC